MVDSNLLITLNNLRRTQGFKLIVLGDWKQLDTPASELDIEEREDSWILGDLCGWQKFRLTVNLRSDAEIFDLCAKVVAAEDASEAFDWLSERVYKKTQPCR
eukprot:Lithocolla_globosa_v1_NODE_16_length_10446_cov_10.815802.p13 type:complete len:102 gc:universal NODE_16_length_10446_cov_10.815802:5621-5926(+)